MTRLVDIRLTVVARLRNCCSVPGTAICTRLRDTGCIAVTTLVDVRIIGTGLSIDRLNDSRRVFGYSACRLINSGDAPTACTALADRTFVLFASLVYIGSVLTKAALFDSRHRELAVLGDIGELAFAGLVDVRRSALTRLNHRCSVAGTTRCTRLGDIGRISIATLIDVYFVRPVFRIHGLRNSRGVQPRVVGGLIDCGNASSAKAVLRDFG